ncbi:aminotransferase class I/II-fold pyridoxal phosphate-dependent enzyme, partial [Pseudomonadota bacterium]
MDTEKKLNKLKEKGLFRSLATLPNIGGKFIWKEQNFLNFSSNDYLNLACNNEVKQSAKNAIDEYGTGSTGSRLMCGHLEVHELLEKKIAQLLGYKATLIFGSGFLTNLGIITALASKNDNIFFDKLDHASFVVDNDDDIIMIGDKG